MRRSASLPSSTVARVRAYARPGRRSLVVAVSLLACLVAPALLTTEARADSIDDKRAQAEAIAQEVEANGQRISQLDEDLLEAQLRVDELLRRIEAATVDVEQTKRATRSTDAGLERRATELYVSGSSGSGLVDFSGSSVGTSAARQIYLKAAAERDNDRIDQLRASRERLDEKIAALDAARKDAEAQRALLDRARADLEEANARQEELLAETKGELAELIAAEQARQAREAEAAARREQQRRADEQARNASTMTTPADNGSDGGNDGGGGDPPDITVVAPNPRAQTAVDAAVAQIGTPYRFAQPGSWDDPDPDYFDCSGLTGWAWARAGYYLPHSSRAQFASLPHVAQDDLLPGDLVFYGSPIHHVGMYIGNGQYVHAPQTGDVVKISSIYRSDWAGAARIPG